MYGCNLYSNISANFEQTYLWDSMPAQLTSSNIPTATLLFHCGVSVDMDYTPTGSGSNLNLATEALKTYFKYEEYATYLEKIISAIKIRSISLKLNFSQNAL